MLPNANEMSSTVRQNSIAETYRRLKIQKFFVWLLVIAFRSAASYVDAGGDGEGRGFGLRFERAARFSARLRVPFLRLLSGARVGKLERQSYEIMRPQHY
jgi:hypothetical protein